MDVFFSFAACIGLLDYTDVCLFTAIAYNDLLLQIDLSLLFKQSTRDSTVAVRLPDSNARKYYTIPHPYLNMVHTITLLRNLYHFPNTVLRAIFCKNQAVWNSDFFKNPSFLHILFLLWSIWIPEFFFKFWWRILKLWLIKVLGHFQQKLIFGWRSNFDTNYI